MKTPKEQAEELCKRYYAQLSYRMLDDCCEYDYAIQCSIIAVEEIIKSNPVSESSGIFVRQNLYWNEVLTKLKQMQ